MILHTVDMNKSAGDYAFLADPDLRTSFYADLNALLGQWDYQVVACVIRKPEHLTLHGANAADPYHYSLDILVERFCWELGAELDSGFICAEKRNPSLDHGLMAAWEALRTRGTQFASAKRIDCRIVGMDLRDKKPNLEGMQLADLVVTPIGRHIVGGAPKPSQVQWAVVESKLRRVGGSYAGKGLVIRP